MTKISREEVLNIARMSKLELTSQEIELVQVQIETVLTYAQRLITVAEHIQEPQTCSVNVYREDMANSFISEPILAQAPSREGDFFGVPAIIEQN